MIETLKTEARINLRVVSPFFAPRPARENFGPKLTKSQLRERERERKRKRNRRVPHEKKRKSATKKQRNASGTCFGERKKEKKRELKRKERIGCLDCP